MRPRFLMVPSKTAAGQAALPSGLNATLRARGVSAQGTLIAIDEGKQVVMLPAAEFPAAGVEQIAGKAALLPSHSRWATLILPA